MAGRPKPTARQAFEDNVDDARTLVALARALRNRRLRRMRRELREKVGTALSVRRRDWPQLECLESEDLFVVFKPGARLTREDLDAVRLRSLLRQAVVAGCTAIETFAADRVMERMGDILRQEDKPLRLLDLPMTVGDWLTIEEQYERRKWGLRQIIELEVRRMASPAPAQIGILFSLVGEHDLWKRVNQRRGISRSRSEGRLEEIYERRNTIAHMGDRDGRGRASITIEEVEHLLDDVHAIVDALDKETVA